MPCLFNRALRTALCVLVAAVLGLAGDPAAGPAMQQPLGFDRFGTREGLSSSWVRDLIQDPRGFLWIATSDGLAATTASASACTGPPRGWQTG